MKKTYSAFVALAMAILLPACAGSGKQSQTDSDAQAAEVTDSLAYLDPEDPNEAIAEIKTTMGDIIIGLFNDTPKHRDNFIKLADECFFDSILFHRVIENFMIQCGDPDSKHAAPGQMLGEHDAGYTIPKEIVYPRHYHRKGAVNAAREGDDTNPEWASSSSQFCLFFGSQFDEKTLDATVERVRKVIPDFQMPDSVRQDYLKNGGSPHLDGQYTVFGEVLSGMDVVDKIQKVATDDFDRPIDDVRILSVRILRRPAV